MPTSYALKERSIPYMLLIMLILIIAVTMLIYASWLGDFQLIMLTFLLISVIALIVIILAWYHKIEPKPKKYEDHRLQ